MNSEEDKKLDVQDAERVKDISKWTKRYVQNRTLTVIVLLVMAMLLGLFVSAFVGFSLALAAIGFRKGNIILGCVGIAVLVAVLVVTVKFIIIFVAKFGGKNRGLIDQIVDRWIYGKEGTASIPLPKITKKMRGLDYIFGAICIIYILGVNHLCMMGYIAFKYQQPITALFLVPAFVFEYFFLMRPKVGLFFLLWPILYAIHAILILAGVPIFFTGYMRFGNMVIPLFGYFLLTCLVGHLYSRYALGKLKAAAKLQEDNNE